MTYQETIIDPNNAVIDLRLVDYKYTKWGCEKEKDVRFIIILFFGDSQFLIITIPPR